MQSMTASGPLAGVRVVELGNLIAAPYAGMVLADLGADVVKIEPPTGDLGRHFGPYLHEESAFFLSVNRGKRSISLDLSDPSHQRIAVAICRDADVIVHNLRQGALERRQLGYEDVAETNPGIVYAQVSAFGSDGPYADRVGIDVIFQAESGMMSLTGESGSGPGKTATTIGDYVAGTNAALAICAALVERNTTRRGRRIDISLRDGLIAVQGTWNAIAFATDRQPDRVGTASPFLAPNQSFETSDGHIAVAIVSDRHFLELCQSLERLELAERFPTNAVRMNARSELAGILGTIFMSNTSEYWVELLSEAGLPVGRVMTLPEVWEDRQVRHNEMVTTYDHPTVGEFRTIGSPFRFDGVSQRSDLPPPILDEHADQIRRRTDQPGM